MKVNNLITIDGISGAGKGTLAKSLALELNYSLLDSGNLYRLVGLIAKRLETSNSEEIAKELNSRKITMEFDNLKGLTEVFFGSERVTEELRHEEVAMEASNFARDSFIRNTLIKHQKDYFDSNKGLIADGRDMGTVIFPEARWKFFLIASIEERAKRRLRQLKEVGLEVNMPTLIDNIKVRDEQDKNRDISPAVPAEDALTIDTSNLSAEELKNKVLEIIKD
jgi:cytidylate kinase